MCFGEVDGQPPSGMILCFAFANCSLQKDDGSEKTIMKLKQNGTNTREKTAKNICGHLIQENVGYIPVQRSACS